MNNPTDPPSVRKPEPLLTPDDTWWMWSDSFDTRIRWATVVHESTVERDGTDPSADEVTSWSVDLIEDETGRRFTVDHDVIIEAMQRIVRCRDTIRLTDTIIDHIAAVLDAKRHEDAMDGLCQLDVIGYDAIVQVATLGQVIYG
jgi:hypothetical protein